MKAQETLTLDKTRDQLQREVRENAHRLLDQAQDAISRLESLGPDYNVWQAAQFSHKVLKQVSNHLSRVK